MPRNADKTGSKHAARPGIDRRTFFAAAGATGASGVAGLTARRTDAASRPNLSRSRAGYRETEHVRTVYRLARF